MDKNGATSTLLLWLLVSSFYEATDAVALGDSCTTDDACTTTVTNSECVGEADQKTCTCVEGYTQQDADCKANKGYGVACSTTDDVCTILGTACIDDGTGTTKCLCGENYVVNADDNGCFKKIDQTCDAASECVANAECSSTCQCLTDFTSNADKTECLKNLGVGCVTNADCGSGVCDFTKATSICALGVNDACAEPNADMCVMYAECTDTTCSCKSGYTESDKLCVGAPGSACEASGGCAENDVCDTNANPVTCALGNIYKQSGAECDADDSKCMTHSECTEDTCTCYNGGADDTTKLCPAPSSGFRETSSMIVVAACLCLSIL